MKVVAALLMCVALAWAEYVDYTGYKVYRITPQSEREIQMLWDVKAQWDEMVDFWRPPTSVGQTVDVMLPPQLQPRLTRFLSNFRANVMIEDVQNLMDTERSADPDRAFLESYNTYSEIEAWLQQTCDSSNKCNLVNIGQSYEGRDMYVAQISVDESRPILFLECGIHAREWIAPAVCLNLINRLVTTDDAMLNEYNFHIITVANPDGYDFTFVENRMWRKTRSPNSGSSCMGCDPNRNFEYEFGGAGTSTNPCSDLFRGASAFSEIETANLRDYVTPLADNIRAYYAVHSFGQYFLIPWSYARNQYPEDFADMLRVGNEGAAAIAAGSGLTYRVGQSADLLGATAGCSDDWAKGSLGIKFAYTIELRDTGFYGFLLPDTQIQENFEEIYDSFEAMVALMASDYPMN